MGARTGAQFLDGLRSNNRELYMEGERVGDVTTHPKLAGGAQSIASVFDRQFECADECLVADPETGEAINISHMMPRNIDDLRLRNEGLSRISEMTTGLMGRTPDYMNMKFAAMAANAHTWAGTGEFTEEGSANLVAFQKRIAREDVSLTHTIIQPNNNKATDGNIVGNKVTIHKVGTTKNGIVVRGARILGTLSPYADELTVYPALPLPPGAEDYAVSFTLRLDAPGLKFICRDSATVPGNGFDRPLSSRFDEQDAFVIFDDVEIPRENLFLDGSRGSVEAYNSFGGPRVMSNMTTQTTIRALNKLEFSYGLGTLMAQAIGDVSPTTNEMLGELQSYVEVTRNAIVAATERGWADDRGVYFLENRALDPMRSLLAVWFPRVNEILTLIGSHNLLANPARKDLDNPEMRPLIDEFMFGANGTDAERRAAIFRLAWDYIGSALGGRNLLYERFYLTSAARNRQMSHILNPDRSRGFGLVESVLESARKTR